MYKNAKKYLQKGFGALVGFELKDGEESGKNFINNLKHKIIFFI